QHSINAVGRRREAIDRIVVPSVEIGIGGRLAGVVLALQFLGLLLALLVDGDLLDEQKRVGDRALTLRNDFDDVFLSLLGVEEEPVLVALGIELAGALARERQLLGFLWGIVRFLLNDDGRRGEADQHRLGHAPRRRQPIRRRVDSGFGRFD